jgi:hypothetical protein
MQALDSQTSMILAGIAILALVVIAAWMYFRSRQTQDLKRRFGPEYTRTVEELGSPAKAESELLARQKRVARMKLVPLAPAEAARFSEAWRALQGQFVDNPKAVLAEADRLVGDLMQKRGYPMGDFDRCAADISVDHPAVVHHYRAAHDIALRDARGEADTEALRQAVVHYRALFAELLEVDEAPPQGAGAVPPRMADVRAGDRSKHREASH